MKRLDLDFRDEEGDSLVVYAVVGGHYDMTKLLIKYFRMDANTRNNIGWTPLHHAARWAKAVHVKLLVDNGADPNAKTDDGKLPIDIAYEYEPNSVGSNHLNYRDIIHYLKNL